MIYREGSEGLLGHYYIPGKEGLDRILEGGGYSCMYKALGEVTGKSEGEIRGNIASAIKKDPGSYEAIAQTRSYLKRQQNPIEHLMGGGYDPMASYANHMNVQGLVGERNLNEYEVFTDRVGGLYKSYIKEVTIGLGSYIGVNKSTQLLLKTQLVKTIAPKIKKQYDIFLGNHTGLSAETKKQLANIYSTGDKKAILKGLKGEGFKLPEKALDKIPQSLKDKNVFQPNDKGIGIKIVDKNGRNSIRIDKGVKKSRHGKILQPHEKIDHVAVRRNGKTIGRDGNVVVETEQYPKPKQNPKSHIPLKEWLNWKSGLEK